MSAADVPLGSEIQALLCVSAADVPFGSEIQALF
jgi:hypothetical protein